jgi:hypothetical protein
MKRFVVIMCVSLTIVFAIALANTEATDTFAKTYQAQENMLSADAWLK